MTKNLLSLVTLLVAFSTFGYAQGQNGLHGNQKSCATMEVFERQLKENPGLEKRMEAIERFTREVVANGNGKGKPAPTDPPEPTPTEPAPTNLVIKIPIVFHVVYNTTAQNVSDAMIAAQLKVLNDDFRKLNADAKNTPTLFASLDADTEIEFVMATVDPSGATTKGITRTYTSVTSFSSNDDIKFTSRGGKDAWDATRYLNFWVGNLGGGLLGYAQFPGGSPATDGVVCLYSSLPGGSATNYNIGRTATHEVGHWMNLRHIWGDRRCGNDYVDDTPTQSTSNGGCPAFPKPTCNNTSDMFMNYMDYTYDRCMYMFTYGQKNRMRSVFATGGPRDSFRNSGTNMVASNSAGANVKLEPAKLPSNVLLVYPNPANSEATISISLADLSSSVSLQVTDVRGKVVHSQNWSDAKASFNHTLNLDKMARGIYFVAVQSGNSREVTKLSIIR